MESESFFLSSSPSLKVNNVTVFYESFQEKKCKQQNISVSAYVLFKSAHQGDVLYTQIWSGDLIFARQQLQLHHINLIFSNAYISTRVY